MNDFVGPVDHGAYNRVEHIDVDVKKFKSTAFLKNASTYANTSLL